MQIYIFSMAGFEIVIMLLSASGARPVQMNRRDF